MKKQSKDYSDIIGKSRPHSKKRKPMSLTDRAAQFSSFAALVGFSDLIEETGKAKEEKEEEEEEGDYKYCSNIRRMIGWSC